MERKKLFTRVRRPVETSSTDADGLERDSFFGGEPAGEIEPSPEYPPSELGEMDLPAPEAKSEKPRRPRGKDARARATRPPAINLSLVRRERRALLRERERRIRDLGGLLLEMYRRDQFREDLLIEHCAQTMGVENRIHELEAILARGNSRRGTTGPHCVCGAPLFYGARFCASCGRPTELGDTGELCAKCLQPLAPGASFCAGCGALVSAAAVPETPGDHEPSNSVSSTGDDEVPPAGPEGGDR